MHSKQPPPPPAPPASDRSTSGCTRARSGGAKALIEPIELTATAVEVDNAGCLHSQDVQSYQQTDQQIEDYLFLLFYATMHT